MFTSPPPADATEKNTEQCTAPPLPESVTPPPEDSATARAAEMMRQKCDIESDDAKTYLKAVLVGGYFLSPGAYAIAYERFTHVIAQKLPQLDRERCVAALIVETARELYGDAFALQVRAIYHNMPSAFGKHKFVEL